MAILNTGFDIKANTSSMIRLIGFMPIFDSNGDENGFTYGSATMAADIASAINNTNATMRLFPLHLPTENPTTLLPELIKETTNVGNIYKVMNKTRESMFDIAQVDYSYMEILKGFEESTNKLGVFYVDTFDNIHGKLNSAKTKIQPIPIKNFFAETPILATQTETNRLKVSYSLDFNAYELLYIMPYTEHKFNMSGWKGLSDYVVTGATVNSINPGDGKTLVLTFLKYYSRNPIANIGMSNLTFTNAATGAVLNLGIPTLVQSPSNFGTYTVTSTADAFLVGTNATKVRIMNTEPTPDEALTGISPEFVSFSTTAV